MLDLEALVPGRPVRLLAMGHLAGSRSATTDNPKIEPLTAVDYLVIAAGGDIPTMIEAISKIKEISPDTKVIYVTKLDRNFHRMKFDLLINFQHFRSSLLTLRIHLFFLIGKLINHQKLRASSTSLKS